jgi:hypothetical protein
MFSAQLKSTHYCSKLYSYVRPATVSVSAGTDAHTAQQKPCTWRTFQKPLKNRSKTRYRPQYVTVTHNNDSVACTSIELALM